MTHTPGEWHVNGIDTVVSVEGNRTVAKIYHPESDARLIASAPELLEALKAITHEWDKSQFRHPITEQVRDVIAKAEGN